MDRSQLNLPFFTQIVLIASWELWKIRNDRIFNNCRVSFNLWFTNFRNQCLLQSFRFKENIRCSFWFLLDAMSLRHVASFCYLLYLIFKSTVGIPPQFLPAKESMSYRMLGLENNLRGDHYYKWIYTANRLATKETGICLSASTRRSL